MSSSVLEMSRQEKLLRVMEERGFTLSQQNGQRIYGGPPPNWGSRVPPSRESEIFIGRIPRVCFEDELIPLFSSVGELYEFRLMLDFSGTNRGFAYAQYAEEEGAYKAIRLLNHYEVRPGHYIGVLRCKNNCRLLFSNIKQDMDLIVFSEQVKSLTKDILKISMFKNFEELKITEIGVTLEVDESFQEKITRYAPESKFAIVEYETHKAAAVARRILIPKLGHMFAIDWAIPPKDSNQFDQGLSTRFDATLATGNDFLKIRPVPLFSPPRSNLDGILYTTSTYRNIAKYFRFLVNITLHKSMRKGDIPLPVYLELEKKILERVKNIEHCSQATQLLLNYLTWYREKMMMFMDPESEKILIEVKYYAEKMLEIARSRVAIQRGHLYCIEERPNNALPVTLSYCYYMAVFLGGDDRDKVCGLITDSLDWFSRLLQRCRDGNEEVNQFMSEISRLAIDMEEERRRGDPFSPLERIRKRKPELMPPSAQIVIGRNLFSGQTFPPLKKSAMTSSEQNSDIMDIDSSVKSKEYPTAVCIYEGDYADNSKDVPIQSCQPCERVATTSTTQSRQDGMNTNSSVRTKDSFTVFTAYNDRNTNGYIDDNRTTDNSGYYGMSRPHPEFTPPELIKNLHESMEKINARGSIGVGYFAEARPFPDFGLGLNSRMVTTVPLLPPRPSTADFSIMPRQFANICPFYKYLITMNLQKSVERCEITLNTYREIMTKIVNEIRHLEGCIEAINLIVCFLKLTREGMLPVSHDQLLRDLDDIKMYASAMVNYVQSRGPSISTNTDLDDYYLCMIPNQMSFLYHLTLLLEDEEKVQLPGRLTESVKWLHDIVQKNKAGDVEVVNFFERIFNIGKKRNNDAKIQDVISNICEEFNTICNLSRRAEK